ncbi:MAG: hypothetical protein ACUVQ4_07860 [bacterium]
MVIVILSFIIIGIFMIITGINTEPLARTGDGLSKKWFFIIFGLSFAIFAIILLIIILLFIHFQKKNLTYLRHYGLRGIARILSCQMTGTEINNVPQYRMQLEIKIQNKIPYTINHTQCLSPLIAGKIQIGMEIPVLVDPQNSKKILLEC